MDKKFSGFTRDVHLQQVVEVTYCDDTQPEQHLARATEQHIICCISGWNMPLHVDAAQWAYIPSWSEWWGPSINVTLSYPSVSLAYTGVKS